MVGEPISEKEEILLAKHYNYQQFHEWQAVDYVDLPIRQRLSII